MKEALDLNAGISSWHHLKIELIDDPLRFTNTGAGGNCILDLYFTSVSSNREPSKRFFMH